MSQPPGEIFPAIRRSLFWATGIALVFLFVWYAWEVLFLAFAGLLLAIILRALADLVERRTGLGPRLSFTLVICGGVVLMVLVGWFIVPRVISQTAQIIAIVPSSLVAARTYLDRYSWGQHVVQLVRQSTMHFDFAGRLAHMVHGLLTGLASLILIVVV
ncbi:MAG TPA: hypothetical protein VII48_07835, partial [Rhizomicrobium sp.]